MRSSRAPVPCRELWGGNEGRIQPRIFMRQRREHYYEPQSMLESQFELAVGLFFFSLGNQVLSNSLPTPADGFVPLAVETAFPCPVPAGARQEGSCVSQDAATDTLRLLAPENPKWVKRSWLKGRERSPAPWSSRSTLLGTTSGLSLPSSPRPEPSRSRAPTLAVGSPG